MDKNEFEVVDEVPELAGLPEVAEGAEDTTDWKAIAAEQQAEALKQQGIAKRLKTKLEKAKEAQAVVPEKGDNKAGDIDYAQEAYLIALGIKESDERALIQERVAATGKSIKDVVENKFFQQDLQELRETKAVRLAVPTSTNRNGTAPRDSVDYWKAKIDSGQATVLDVPDVQLRRKIVNSRLAQEKNVNKFTDNPFGTMNLK